MVDDLVVILGYQYRSTAIVSGTDTSAPPFTSLELHGQPRSRAPHVWLERQGQRISTLDLFGTRFVLLSGSEGSAWYDAAKEIATTLGVELDAYRVVSDSDLGDPEERWHAGYGVTCSGAVLVRPDGFIGWRAEKLEGNAWHILEVVLKHLLRRV